MKYLPILGTIAGCILVTFGVNYLFGVGWASIIGGMLLCAIFMFLDFDGKEAK